LQRDFAPPQSRLCLHVSVALKPILIEDIPVSRNGGRRGYDPYFCPDISYGAGSSLPLHHKPPLRHDEGERRYPMRKQLATLAIAALLGVPLAVNAETYMPSDDQLQPGMSEGDRVDTTEVLDSSETIKAEIVEIDGNRLITEMENGDQLVFLVDGSSDNLNVGDELELKVDDQAKSAVILNVLPQDKDRQS
jgi:hypothetical protein